MPWQKGQSGNPNGRPPKDRTLAALLETAGRRRVAGPGGEHVDRRKVAVENVWDLLAFGRVTFPGQKAPWFIGGRDYVELTKFVFGHIDGPAPTKLEHSSDPDRPLTIRVEYDDGDCIAPRPGAHLAATAATLLPSPDVSGGEAV